MLFYTISNQVVSACFAWATEESLHFYLVWIYRYIINMILRPSTKICGFKSLHRLNTSPLLCGYHVLPALCTSYSTLFLSHETSLTTSVFTAVS